MRPHRSALLRHPGLQAATAASRRPVGIATGDHRLDALLHWRGWPAGNLIELSTSPGHGEFTLVAPALARLMATGGWIFLIDPPHLPHAQALGQIGLPGDRLLVLRCAGGRDQLWAGEQILRAGTCAALLLWEGAGHWRQAQLLRLQSAARTAGVSVFLYRRPDAARQPSPAPLRIALVGSSAGTRLTLRKQPGPTGQSLLLTPAVAAAPSWRQPATPAGIRHADRDRARRQPSPAAPGNPARISA